jgi:Mlc titration factor MtfA (ptsG expression regulator)
LIPILLLAGLLFTIYSIIFEVRLFRQPYLSLLFLFSSTDFQEALDLDNILQTSNPYYKRLSPEGKKRFIKKCFQFMQSKEFIGMQGLKITDEIIATISGTAAQISFGLHKSTFRFYHTIKVFPETFYSGLLDTELKGGASIGGVLYFSWKDFKEGYADSTDRYNLGLHEMGHALRMELLHGNDYDKRFARYAHQWVEVAIPEFNKMNEGHTSFLRDYASTNIEEFFAVCVEHFFEVPAEFRKHLPEIYDQLSFLLNQDPLNTSMDFKLKPDFVAKFKIEKPLRPILAESFNAYRREFTWHWSFNLILTGFTIAIPGVFVLLSDSLISIQQVFSFFTLILFGAIAFRNYFAKQGITGFAHLIIFAVMGIGINLFFGAMVINKYVTHQTDVHKFKISGYAFYIGDEASTVMEFELENNAYAEFPVVRTFDIPKTMDAPVDADSLVVYTNTGLFGWKNYERSKLQF